MPDITGPQFDQDALDAGLDLIGRSGAKQIEIGWLHDGVPVAQMGWYAHAQYHGTRITAESCGPVEAVEALARRLLAGGTCTFCGLKVALSDHPGKWCRWTRQGAAWVRGCEATHAERNQAIVDEARQTLRGDLNA